MYTNFFMYRSSYNTTSFRCISYGTSFSCILYVTSFSCILYVTSFTLVVYYYVTSLYIMFSLMGYKKLLKQIKKIHYFHHITITNFITFIFFSTIMYYQSLINTTIAVIIPTPSRPIIFSVNQCNKMIRRETII